MDIFVIIVRIVAAVIIVHSVSHIILMLTWASAGYAYLPAYLVTFIIWVVAPDQMVWVALTLFLIFLPVRVNYIHRFELPREKWQAHVKANIYQQIQHRWPDIRVIKVRGYAFAKGGHPLPRYPTLFVPADSPVLSDETVVESDWQIEEFNFLNLHENDEIDLNIYLALRLRVGNERFILPIAVARNIIDKLKIDEEAIHILHTLNQAKHLSFMAYSEEWSKESKSGKYKSLPLIDRSGVYYYDVIAANKHYSLEIPPPSIQALEAYITNHEMDLVPRSSFTPDQQEVITISFYKRNRCIEYIPHEPKTRSIRSRIVKFLFMPLPPFPDPYQ